MSYTDLTNMSEINVSGINVSAAYELHFINERNVGKSPTQIFSEEDGK